MALATQCPHCHTTFRVAHDQLKLRAGIVRCGQCQQTFNGIAHLLPSTEVPLASALQSQVDSAPTPVTPPDTAVDMAIDTAVDADRLDDFDVPHHGAPEDIALPVAAEEQAPTPHHADTDASPITQPALPDIDLELATASDVDTDVETVQQPDNPAQAIATNFTKDASEEPGFVTAARRQPQQLRHKRWLFGTGCAVLTLVLLAQTAYGLRNTLAAYLPQAKPALLTMCAMLGCSITLPAHIDAISIESSELQAQPGNTDALTLSLLLRNRSNSVQAWPNLELILQDGTDRVIVRRVFAPREFPLKSADIAHGFAANSEKSVRLNFTLTQQQAAGYRVVLFYP